VAKADPPAAKAGSGAPGVYGKKRHCYICKRREGAKEDRAEFRDDPACAVVRIYASTPRCVPCQRLFSRRSYHKMKAKHRAARDAAMAAVKQGTKGNSPDAASDSDSST
jgi:hypothetical protein